MQRYFVNNEQISNNKVIINNGDFHHIKNVMRMKVNQQIFICDKSEHVYLCELEHFFDDYLELKIIEPIFKKVELELKVTIALGLTKRDKQEEVLRRITELGASGFVSVEMERSVVKIKDFKESKMNRMMTIVKEASEQSHRNKLLKVYEPQNMKSFLSFASQFPLKLYAYEEEGRKNNASLKTVLTNCEAAQALILVGPEGGFSSKEVETLDANGFIPIGLGPRILRCETAPLYIMSAISYELELKNES